MYYNWNDQYRELFDRTMDTLLQSGISQDFAEVLATERCILTALKRSGAISHPENDTVEHKPLPDNVISFPILSYVLDVT